MVIYRKEPKQYLVNSMIYITLIIYADAKKKEKIQTLRFDDKLEACPTCKARILLAYAFTLRMVFDLRNGGL